MTSNQTMLADAVPPALHWSPLTGHYTFSGQSNGLYK